MKNNQTFEKQLINFDEVLFRGQVGDFENNRDILNKIAELYEGLFTGKITHERAGQVLAGNYSALKEAAILEVAKSARNQMLAEVAIQRTEERLTEFETEAARMVYRFNQSGQRPIYATLTPIDWFEINSDGRFFIPEVTMTRIKENCSNYISNPEGQALFGQLRKLADIINEVHDCLGENFRQHFGNQFEARHFNICALLATDEQGRSIADPWNDYNQLTR